MKFHKPSFKLASLYLAIIMAISLFFSGIVYQMSLQELDRGLRRPGQVLGGPRGEMLPLPLRQQLADERQEIYDGAKQRILNRLILTNIAILLASGILSYYLARRTLEPIEQAHESLERFTADASHELRTPITAMRTEIEVALMNPKLSMTDAKKLLKSNIEELNKLTALTEGLLRLAQLEEQEIDKQPIEAAQLIDAAVNRMSPLAKKQGVTIKQSIRPKSLALLGDMASLTEALVIILDNAIKYSQKGYSVQITASKSQNTTLITVTDQGIGIVKNDLPYIFDRFYRSDVARSNNKAKGYGLGLAIAKSIIEAHGGKITATSHPGKGSLFTISL